ARRSRPFPCTSGRRRAAHRRRSASTRARSSPRRASRRRRSPPSASPERPVRLLTPLAPLPGLALTLESMARNPEARHPMQGPFTAEHEAFRRSVRAWVEKELTPHALEWDRAGIFPREVFTRAGELGFLAASHDPRWGGSGGDYWFVVAFTEELSRSQNAGVNMALLVQSQIATPVIGALGTEEQKREFLAPALAGKRIAALGISEPDAGSDVASMRTAARRVGDEYVIDGSKMWITNGTRADFIILGVRTGGPSHGGISLVTFPTEVKGFSVSKKLDKVGNLSSDTAVLYFDGCRIPARYLLGEENGGCAHPQRDF